MKGSEILKKKYGDLHTSEEVESAEWWSGEPMPKNPSERIQKFLDIFTRLINWPNHEERQRGLDAIKQVLYSNFVIKPEDVPESVFLLEQRIARELGHGDVEITDEFKQEKINQIIANQTNSLDKWVDYLTSSDADYPDWAKYWAIRSILYMGKYVKEEDENGKEMARFTKRTKDTVASFAPWNPRALAMTIASFKSKLEEENKPKDQRNPVENVSNKLNSEDFLKLLSTENFSKIYAQFLIEMPEYSTEGLQETRGKWVKYEQGSDAHELVNSLEGYPLEWCTAEYDTAQSQLSGGDFYVYYSLNDAQEAKIPRVAIRMDANGIAEVRGIAPDQHVDPYIGEVVQKKMHEFPDGKEYEKKAADMKQLTAIENKIKAKKDLNKEELIFLYEIDHKIQGFGYGGGSDPRVAELRNTRNSNEDAPIVFECSPNQIAHKVEDITKDTKAYIGKLEAGIFDKLPKTLEHIYTKFPEGRIVQKEIKIGGKDKKELQDEMIKDGFKVGDYAKSMLENKEFKTSKTSENIDLVILSVADLGFPEGARRDKIYERAKEMGLEIAPAEVGPQLRLQYADQPMDEYLVIGMEPISDSSGSPGLFSVPHNSDGRFLDSYRGLPDDGWSSYDRFVFVRRK